MGFWLFYPSKSRSIAYTQDTHTIETTQHLSQQLEIPNSFQCRFFRTSHAWKIWATFGIIPHWNHGETRGIIPDWPDIFRWFSSRHIFQWYSKLISRWFFHKNISHVKSQIFPEIMVPSTYNFDEVPWNPMKCSQIFHEIHHGFNTAIGEAKVLQHHRCGTPGDLA